MNQVVLRMQRVGTHRNGYEQLCLDPWRLGGLPGMVTLTVPATTGFAATEPLCALTRHQNDRRLQLPPLISPLNKLFLFS